MTLNKELILFTPALLSCMLGEALAKKKGSSRSNPSSLPGRYSIIGIVAVCCLVFIIFWLKESHEKRGQSSQTSSGTSSQQDTPAKLTTTEHSTDPEAGKEEFEQTAYVTS
mmetsp:Transcript_2340/g.4320  ORF Transcript_2340/g.4320 Transcript_2340/m.4320 type:complete len:111 (-) Transcript_2340:594-926(-)